ncbi:hypothetical protein ACFLY6_02780, partial [Candidatus Dependentiae bacterium]
MKKNIISIAAVFSFFFFSLASFASEKEKKDIEKFYLLVDCDQKKYFYNQQSSRSNNPIEFKDVNEVIKFALDEFGTLSSFQIFANPETVKNIPVFGGLEQHFIKRNGRTSYLHLVPLA